MTDIGWLSQPYPPEGATAAEGIRNQLGRPELDHLTVLVREAAQNSWDARAGSGPVDFRIDLSAVSPAHAGNWRDLLLRHAPQQDQLPLRKAITSPVIHTLTVSDRGTTGLGGPTRADDATSSVRDFVSFIRNAGEPRDKALGGGTYGFGKGIFYLLSRSGTILVHTRCQTETGYQTRLIGCSLWHSYTAQHPTGPVRHTGRHWWGRRGADGVVEPLIDEDAVNAAKQLGLAQFRPDETGTSIVIVDPFYDEQTPAEAANYLAQSMTWQLWPKMLDTPNQPAPMRFGVSHDGVEIPVPDPRSTAPLDMFVEAYDAAVQLDATRLHCYRPRRELGSIGMAKRLMMPLPATPAAATAGLDQGVHHVCLMRPAELVVRYLPGPKPLSDKVGYAGVFRAHEALDEVYAKAEPPTHDNWIADQLEGEERTFIRMTFQRIRETLDEFNQAGTVVRSSSAAVPLGAASSMFSGLIAGVWGAGGATDYGGGRPVAAQPAALPGSPDDAAAGFEVGEREAVQVGTGGTLDGSDTDHRWEPPGTASRSTRSVPRRPTLAYVGDALLDHLDGVPVIIQAFTLPVSGSQCVRADLNVVIAGSATRETQAPAAADIPIVLGWRSNDGRFINSTVAELEGGDDRIWQVVVRPAAHTITEIELHVAAGGAR
ncbi:hypothetical protein CS0771_32310 [Catellatospora sp. IY07-71]|uniref:hypothetical protein n=1 Tax=Catellatospora sp. IY07-71 TaxID=2728827 RepID=UPI001BB42ACC|nr:hypothetical protein [Catellatospora sp. IY07-71]BCJ73687.1 hypothetical protein CS0771_32310 [Catellatospora sp. IY07-71]